MSGRRLVACLSALAVLGGLAGAAPAAAEEPRLILWGAHASTRPGEDSQRAYQRVEASAGRKLAVARHFLLWDTVFPTTLETWLRDGDRQLMLSVNAKRLNGSRVSWRDIANATPGSPIYADMLRWTQRIRDFSSPVMLTLNHEPEASVNTGSGVDADYKAAWQAWVTLFRTQGVSNVTFVWIMTDYSFQVPSSDRRFAAKWYPGDAFVDAIAGDAYNWFTCRPGINTAWKSLAQIIEGQRVFGLAHPTKPLWLAEYGSDEDPAQPGRKAQWFRDAQALFAQPGYAQFAGVNLFEQLSSSSCPWAADSSTTAAAAWRAWGADPLYGGSAVPPPPPISMRAQLVVGDPASLGADATIKARLETLGYTVDVVDDNAASAAGAAGRNVVLVSQSVTPTALTNRLRDVPIPVVILKPWLYDDFALVAANALGSNGRTSVTVTNPSHPLASGLSGHVALVTSSTPMGWGTTLTSAEVVATVVGHPAVFAYRPGAALDQGRTSAACRVGLPYHQTAYPVMTAAGWTMFDAAVRWADSGC